MFGERRICGGERGSSSAAERRTPARQERARVGGPASSGGSHVVAVTVAVVASRGARNAVTDDLCSRAPATENSTGRTDRRSRTFARSSGSGTLASMTSSGRKGSPSPGHARRGATGSAPALRRLLAIPAPEPPTDSRASETPGTVMTTGPHRRALAPSRSAVIGRSGRLSCGE